MTYGGGGERDSEAKSRVVHSEIGTCVEKQGEVELLSARLEENGVPINSADPIHLNRMYLSLLSHVSVSVSRESESFIIRSE